MARTPFRASVSMACRSVSGFNVAVLTERKVVSRERSRIDAVDAQYGAHAIGGAVGIGEQRGTVGEAEELGEMDERAGALLAADHGEMALMAVEIGHEDDAGLVEAGRCPEDVARQRDRP